MENVYNYGNLGQRYTTTDKNEDKEIISRLTVGWTTVENYHNMFKSNVSTRLIKQVCNLRVIPAVKHGLSPDRQRRS